jgi:hypothetical protein
MGRWKRFTGRGCNSAAISAGYPDNQDVSRNLEAFSQYCYTQNSVSPELKQSEHTQRTWNRRMGPESAQSEAE